MDTFPGDKKENVCKTMQIMLIWQVLSKSVNDLNNYRIPCPISVRTLFCILDLIFYEKYINETKNSDSPDSNGGPIRALYVFLLWLKSKLM